MRTSLNDFLRPCSGNGIASERQGPFGDETWGSGSVVEGRVSLEVDMINVT